jgi:hypothetical protein
VGRTLLSAAFEFDFAGRPISRRTCEKWIPQCIPNGMLTEGVARVGRTLQSAAFDVARVARAPSPAKGFDLGWRKLSALRYRFKTHLPDG